MTRAWSDPPIDPYHRVPVQVYQADPDAPEVARRLIALIGTRWPATPAEHVGSSAVPGLAGKGIIDLLVAAEPAHIPAITQALLELGFQPQSPAAFPPTRPMLWGTFRHGATTYRVHVHVVPASSPEVAAMRGFRDALRADPVLRRRYAALKRAIVAGGPADPVAFTRAKHDWIAATLAHLGLADDPPRRLYQDDLNRTGRASVLHPATAKKGRTRSRGQHSNRASTPPPPCGNRRGQRFLQQHAAISTLAASRREGKHMHNQHAGLSQQLAAQRISERQEQAAQAQLAQSAGRPRRRRWLARRWWQLARRPGLGRPAARHPHPVR